MQRRYQLQPFSRLYLRWGALPHHEVVTPVPTPPAMANGPPGDAPRTPMSSGRSQQGPTAPATPSLVPVASWRAPHPGRHQSPVSRATILASRDPSLAAATAASSNADAGSRSPSGIPIPTWRFLQQDSLASRPSTLRTSSSSLSALSLSSLASEAGPKTIAEALRSKDAPEWTKAMVSEMESMRTHGVWELVEPPPRSTNVIGCKWVYKLKRNGDGEIERYKARLVAQGYNQKFGVDYFSGFQCRGGF